MNSPYRAHPALPISVGPGGNTSPFPNLAAASPPPLPKPQGPSKLELLIAIEAEIRNQPNATALALHALNETRILVGFEQAFWIRLNQRGEPKVELSSSVARVEPQAPLTRAIGAWLKNIKDLNKPFALALNLAKSGEDYPLSQAFWVPFLNRGATTCFGGLLFTKAELFDETEQLIAKRLGQTYGHAFLALTPPSLLRKISVPRWLMVATPLMVLALFFIPVPMTSLAPFEVIARNPTLVTAPIDGAILDVLSEPNSSVKAGDLLFRFDDTVLRSESSIAEQRAVVAETKLSTAQNGAFTEIDMKRALGELQAEVDLAHAERDYAKSLLERSSTKAMSSGVLIYSAKSDLIGKPVRIGEKIMEIANPSDLAYRIDLAVHDSISLEQHSRVNLFFDADPLYPRGGALYEMSYHATERPGGLMAYTLKAEPSGERQPLRIGSRGTAQIIGDKVSLGFYLFRRPIAGLRQYFGL